MRLLIVTNLIYLGMNSAGKYLQRRKRISDENLNSLWNRLIREQADKQGMPPYIKTESQPEHKEKVSDTDNDFTEVWLSIEESIFNYECKQAKKKEEQSYKSRSKTNLNFEL
jgi:hypothetical protein